MCGSVNGEGTFLSPFHPNAASQHLIFLKNGRVILFIQSPLGMPTSSSALRAQGADEDVGVPRGAVRDLTIFFKK